MSFRDLDQRREILSRFSLPKSMKHSVLASVSPHLSLVIHRRWPHFWMTQFNNYSYFNFMYNIVMVWYFKSQKRSFLIKINFKYTYRSNISHFMPNFMWFASQISAHQQMIGRDLPKMPKFCPAFFSGWFPMMPSLWDSQIFGKKYTSTSFFKYISCTIKRLQMDLLTRNFCF